MNDLNFESLYPDPLRDARESIAPHKMVIDENIPDDQCIIIEWSEPGSDGLEKKYRYRFLKDVLPLKLK